jgi:hypothetical protein
MATMTINISEDIAKRFREAVKTRIGEGKGILGRAVEQALAIWIHEKLQEQIADRQKKLMAEGVYSLRSWKFNRDEIHER